MTDFKTYCGNNKLYKGLTSGTHTIGTRRQCLRKGIGVSMNQDIKVDESNALWYDEYDPIDTRKIYCGDKKYLPEGYDYMGNTVLCLEKGKKIGYILNLKKKSKEYLDSVLYDDDQSSQDMQMDSSSRKVRINTRQRHCDNSPKRKSKKRRSRRTSSPKRKSTKRRSCKTSSPKRKKTCSR